MEIKRLNKNQIRCTITEQEIEELGFQIDDIIGNTEDAQKFMNVVLGKIAEQEKIDTELTSPIVRAELLPDHSMTLTFGGITEEEKNDMIDRIMNIIDRLAGNLPTQHECKKTKDFTTSVTEKAEDEEEDIFQKPTPFALEFLKLEDAVRISKCFRGENCIPESALYKNGEKYYLIMDFIHFSKKALRPFAFAAVEYDNHHFASEATIAHLKEHGTCLIAQDAISQLMQL